MPARAAYLPIASLYNTAVRAYISELDNLLCGKKIDLLTILFLTLLCVRRLCFCLSKRRPVRERRLQAPRATAAEGVNSPIAIECGRRRAKCIYRYRHAPKQSLALLNLLTGALSADASYWARLFKHSQNEQTVRAKNRQRVIHSRAQRHATG